MADDRTMDDGRSAEGGQILYVADLGPLNDSGVSGTAFLTIDDDTLATRIVADGLEPDMVHPQHIHGRFADTEDGPGTGQPIDSVSPTLLTDDDNDGFIELEEGLDTYGPIIVPLTSPPGGELSGFPTAPDGTIFFEEIYDLSDEAVFADGFSADGLTPLDLREIVLHGDFVPAGAGEGTPGEVNGGPEEYVPVLPVASGEIEALTDNFGTFVDGTDGDDTLTGTERADVFFYTGGADTIGDFDADEGDRIVLANGADLRTALENATETDEGVVLSFDDGSLTLAGVTTDEVNQLADPMSPSQTHADDMMA